MKIKNIIIPAAIALLVSSCYKPEDYTNIESNEVLALQTCNADVKANGVDEKEIVVVLSNKAESKRSVLFVTTLGSFTNGKDSMYEDARYDNARDKLVAKTFLSSVRAGEAIVTAYAQNVKAVDSVKITFTSANPNRISVSVDSFSIENDFRKEVLITASLSTENGGKPSVGHRVDFSVLQNNMPVGTFLNGRSYGFTDAEGKVRVRYAADKNTPAGLAVIRAETVSDLGNIITANTQIYIKN